MVHNTLARSQAFHLVSPANNPLPPTTPPTPSRKGCVIISRKSKASNQGVRPPFPSNTPSAPIIPQSPTQITAAMSKAIFDQSQRRRLASLGQKFLRTFLRERARNWLPDRGGDRQLSIVYGPSSPWGKREALRLQREQYQHIEKVATGAAAGEG